MDGINTNKIIKSHGTASDVGYTNIILHNNTSEPFPITYNSSEHEPILKNPSDYDLIVSRYKIPMYNVPLFFFKDKQYFISLSIGDTYQHPTTIDVKYDVRSSQAVTYPQNRAIYYYNQFISCVNIAFADLFTQANALVGTPYNTAFPGFNNLAPPIARVSKQGTYIELLLPLSVTLNSCFGNVLNPNNINIIMSPDLYYFFAGFQSQENFNGYHINNNINAINNEPKMTHKLDVRNYINGYSQEVVPAQGLILEKTYNVVQQDWGSLSQWQTITRILVTTSLPINSESLITLDGSDKTVRQAILTDFLIPSDESGIQRDYLYYNDTGNRNINFKTDSIIDSLSLNILYEDKDLTLHKLLLYPGQECSMKLKFQRKKNPELLKYSSLTNQLQYF